MLKKIVLAAVLAFAAAAHAGTFNLTVTFPDAQQTRIVNALKVHWTVDGVAPTTPQVLEKLRLMVRDEVRDIVVNVERDAATSAAAAGVTPPDVQ